MIPLGFIPAFDEAILGQLIVRVNRKNTPPLVAKINLLFLHQGSMGEAHFSVLSKGRLIKRQGGDLSCAFPPGWPIHSMDRTHSRLIFYLPNSLSFGK
jgi:hypothetical protein